MTQNHEAPVAVVTGASRGAKGVMNMPSSISKHHWIYSGTGRRSKATTRGRLQISRGRNGCLRRSGGAGLMQTWNSGSAVKQVQAQVKPENWSACGNCSKKRRRS